MANQPLTAISKVMPKQKPTTVPNVRRAPSMSLAPKRCPILTVPAMPKPKAVLDSKNIMILALAVAANAASPISRPTQIELTVPFSDWSALESSVGRLKSISVFKIGPSVRLPVFMP